ncbi:MAG: hypothetical protein QW625_03400 [Candidatus Nanoarchaeia archaeon]
MAVYRRNGCRVKSIEFKNNGVRIDELKIDEVDVLVPENSKLKKGRQPENSKLKKAQIVDWIDYEAKRKLREGNLTNIEQIVEGAKIASKRLGTFTVNGWRIVENKGRYILVFDIEEQSRGYLEFGVSTTTSGEQDLLGKLKASYRKTNGSKISGEISSGKLDNETIVNGSLSYYNPHVLTINGERIFSNISIFRESYINYLENNVDTKLGGSIELGSEVGKNSTVWVRPFGYGLEGSGLGVFGLYTGYTYDTRKENTGNYFSIYAGPIYSGEGIGVKGGVDGRKYIPLPKDGTLALRFYSSLGTNLPQSEIFYFGNNQGLWRGMLEDILTGQGLLGASAEVRTKKYKIYKNVYLQPYLFIDAGTLFDWDDGKFNLLPWGGGGLRIYAPVIGCINLFFGWPIGTSGIPHFGFTLGESW